MTTPPELVIIKYILIYNNYTKYIRYIDISKDFKEVNLIFKSLELLHSKFPNTDKTVDELETFTYAAYPQLSKAERESIYALFQKIKNAEISPAIAETSLELLRKRQVAREAAIAFLDASEGRRPYADAMEIVSVLSEKQTVSESLESRNFVTSDLYALRDKTISGGGLYWPLSSLNLSLGPLRTGDFGFIFARPESGKTTLLAHATTHFAKQATTPGIWFNNEEQGEKVRVRTFQATLGCTTDELFRSIDKYQGEYDRLIGGRLLIYDDATINKREVEAIVEAHKPSFIVFDQIDKIQGFAADRQDLVFGRIYQWARELAKSYCPVIGVCQADGTGEGVKWLTMSHVAEAKTSKQAEADWILGVGRSNEGGTESVRFFNISKNKLMGDDKTDPELRHGRFDVWIYPQIARYGDII